MYPIVWGHDKKYFGYQSHFVIGHDQIKILVCRIILHGRFIFSLISASTIPV